MRSFLVRFGTCAVPSALLVAGCSLNLGEGEATPPTEDPADAPAIAGANANDRSLVKDGEAIATGSMIVSPSGRYIVMQRNSVTLIHDVQQASYRETAFYAQRVGFSPNADVAYITHAQANGVALSAIHLGTGQPLWSTALPEGAASLRVSPAGDRVLITDSHNALFLDAASGKVSARFVTPNLVNYTTWVPNSNRALLVGQTSWFDGKPHTPIVIGDALSGAVKALDVPNCEAPVVVTPDGARAFLSPTYCVPGAQAVPGQTWTNPDPVSVIDLDASGGTFLKNLPGFGPVAMDREGQRVVAYLDTKRMDASMFDDPKQVPWKDGQRYHLMTINPKTLSFSLVPIGNAIPRFAMTVNGRGLLVDATAQVSSRAKLAARARLSVSAEGVSATVEQNVFGSGRAFGVFDLVSQSYQAFEGASASLDRFVQFADGRRVLALTTRSDGLGGDPFLIDIGSKTVIKLGCNYQNGVRDVGISPDGRNAYLRLRLSATHRQGGFYSREALSVTADGGCSVDLQATYEASTPFALDPPPPPPYSPPPPPPECREQHDC